MRFETNVTMATCAAISAASSNFAATKGLISVILFELIIIIIIVIIIFTLIAVFVSWLEKYRGVSELPPLNFMELGGGDDDP